MDKVILDEKSFKALSAESRVNILKKLNERRMTLSELSKRLSLQNSTIKEHCNLLLDANLVKKIDEGRKWKYYELTDKGKQIIIPNQFSEIKAIVSLSISAIILMGFIFFILPGIIGLNNISEPTDNLKAFENTEITITAQTPQEENILIDQNFNTYGINYNLFAISTTFALIIGIFAGWIVGRKV